jgi:protein TonB
LQQYLANSINYPLIAQENGIQGKVFISFVINENGDISDVTLVRGVDAALDKEALRVIRSLPKWKPGKQGGKAVKVRYNVPINFELH